jgi:transcriptional regulator with XRE-family HTH domain
MPARATSIRRTRPGRARAQDMDRHVGARLRERRIRLGLTQQAMAKLIGMTYQQIHKYEKGINRLAAGRLYQIAQTLDVEVSYFFEGLETEHAVIRPNPQQPRLLELARNFVALPSRRHQEALCILARVLANAELTSETERAVSSEALESAKVTAFRS